ncbi:unnamed protein product [Haemonchus placei]|uniref:Molydop_binding domain-containing protein n=1 Tax=Haemonchus placei TaxID=6290 RepID=A0A0N4WU69_HAEPC|nr:unnamed protein product [Haemonchus placei]
MGRKSGQYQVAKLSLKFARARKEGEEMFEFEDLPRKYITKMSNGIRMTIKASDVPSIWIEWIRWKSAE